MLEHLFMNFGFHFGIQNQSKRAKMFSVRMRSKRAQIAITNDCENMHLDMYFTVLLEHQASQESLKTVDKDPKMVPGNLQEPLKNSVHFLSNFSSSN